MDQTTAVAILHDEVVRLRALAYEVLVAKIGKHEHRKVPGSNGKEYQISVDVFWDSHKNGDVRVIVAIDDGGFSALVPTVEDFIKAPDGSFVGE
jgi:hypothetical protein